MAPRKDFRRIGLLVPSSSSVQERDIARALPDDITLHVARMRLSNVDAESTLRIVQEIETESQKLADVDVDVIIFPATAPSSRNGIGYDQELVKRITAASGKPATTASTALLEALHVLSVKRIVLGAPWSASVNQSVAAFIEANGVEVLAQEALGLTRNLEIGLLDPQTAYDVGRRVNRPEADAVMLACGNWSTFSIIDQLEHDLGKPVLTTNQVSLWHALKMMGMRPLGGLGVLLREHLGDEAARHTVRAGTEAQDTFFLSIQCPMVSVDEIAGLVQTIAHNGSDDKIDLTVLGKSVGHDEQRLLAVLDLLEKLGLAKLIAGRAELTPVGSRYARASGHARRLIFADQLALSVPWVKSVQSKVAAHPKREVHLAEIAADLRHRDPSSAIDRTLRQLIDWARYAGLLHYDDQTGLVSLPATFKH